MNNINENKKGQVLLFVVVAMTISLAMGLSIANRTVTTTSETARTDTYSRLKSATDATLESMLSKSVAELNTAITTPPPPFQYDYTEGGENIQITVPVVVTTQNTNFDSQISGDTAYLNYQIEEGTTAQYSISAFDNNTMKVCWVANNPSESTALHFTFYNTDTPASILGRHGIRTSSSISGDFQLYTTTLSTSVSPFYRYCTNVSVPNGTEFVRITSVVSDVNVGLSRFSPSNSSLVLDNQVYKITAVAELTDTFQVEERHEAVVYKSLPYVTLPLDFAVYSEDVGWSF